MLHPVNRPACIDALWLAVFIQEALLDLSLNLDPTNINNLDSIFGDEIVKWLWRYKQVLVDPIKRYYEHANLNEKEEILVAFRHDISYYRHFDDPIFSFQLRPKANLPSPLSKIVGDWLQKYYDVITDVKRGFPASVSGYIRDINAQVINSEALAANKGLYVCPACDGIWMEKTSTGVLGSIDHFLPKSSYPALSVHPFNILPICTTCNEKIKKDNDPLTYRRSRPLSETFHSYIRPARTSIKLIVGNPDWIIVSDGGYSQNQLLMFHDLFDLPGRWQQDVDEFDRTVRRRLRDSVNAVKDEKGSVDQLALERILVKLDERLYNDWGGVGNGFPATWYFRWSCQNKKPELVRDFIN